MKSLLYFFKKYWKETVLVIIVVALAFLAWRQQISLNLYEEFSETYNQQAKDFNKQIAELNKLQEDNKKFKEQLEKDYKENVRNLDNKYKTDIDKLSKKISSDKAILIKDGIEDPCKLLNLFVEIYGTEKFSGVMTQCQ